MNKAEYLMKNYGDRGGCWPRRTTPSEISMNSSYDTKAEFKNCFIVHSK